MTQSRTELDELWARLLARDEPPPVGSSVDWLQLRQQLLILSSRLESIATRQAQLSGNVYDLFDTLLHQATGPPPDPKLIQQIMRKLHEKR